MTTKSLWIAGVPTKQLTYEVVRAITSKTGLTSVLVIKPDFGDDPFEVITTINIVNANHLILSEKRYRLSAYQGNYMTYEEALAMLKPEQKPTPLTEPAEASKQETDPNGLDLNTPGAKADAGKVRPALVLGAFANALLEVSKVGTYGAQKYTENGWLQVPDGLRRYDEATLRHWLAEKAGQTHDKDTNLLHAAHLAWNSLARLELLLEADAK